MLTIRSIAGVLTFTGGVLKAASALAATLVVAVQTTDGRALAGAVVTVRGVTGSGHPGTAVAAIVDQINKAFVPDLVVIPTGSTIEFPNTDSVSHQIYSFSAAKKFQLPLYRGKPYPPDELAAFGTSLVCAACKPAFTQKIREGIQPAGAMRYAGFWIRFVAVIVDGIALYIVGMVFFAISMIFFKIDWANFGRSQADLMQLLALEGVWALFNLIVSATYETWMIGRFGATLGKMACSLLVVNSDGTKVSYQRSLGRHFAKYLSSFTLAIGYIMAGLDEEKRSLHDRICDTRVIKK